MSLTTATGPGPDRTIDALYAPQPIRLRDLPLGSGLFRTLLDGLYDGVYFVDRDRRILFWNRAAERLSGYAADEVLGSYCFANILDHTDEAGCHLCHDHCPLVAAVQEGRTTHARVMMRCKDGRRMPVDVHVSPIRDEQGRILGGLEVFRDATATVALERAFVAMRSISLKDPLTGLSNRRHLDGMLELNLELLSRTGLPFAAVLADLDHFKRINDTYGHAAGDQALRGFAVVLRAECRREDVVGRFGGEEFLILAPGRSAAEGVALADRLRRRLAEHFARAWGGLTASFGVTSGQLGDTPDSLIRRVDAALYRAKDLGRNRVELGPEAGRGATVPGATGAGQARGGATS